MQLTEDLVAWIAEQPVDLMRAAAAKIPVAIVARVRPVIGGASG